MSDIGTALVNTSSSGFYVIDMKTNATLAHYEKSGSKGISISPEGNYILFSDDSVHLVKLTGSTFKKIWSDDLSKLPKFFGFDVTNPEQLTFWDGNVLSIKDCSSFSTINEFPLTESILCNVDYYNNEFLTYKPGTPGHLYIRDYSTGGLKSDIPVNLDLSMWWNIKVYLFNHYLVCNNGFMDLFE
jgi:dipeptidyl aminopeptidase/acylaminoacyl peptidase